MAQRRTKVEVIHAKIAKIEEKIAAYTEKIADLENDKSALDAQLDEIREAEKKAQEEAEVKRLVKFMRKNNLSLEELENMLTAEQK